MTREHEIRAAYDAGDHRRAFTRAVEIYGSELVGFIAAIVRNQDRARDLFAQVCENLWRAMPQFAWRSSFRTWAYRAARNAALREVQQAARRVRLDTDEAARVALMPRTTTAPFRRTENKVRLERLRRALDAEDQALLTLRIDRAMGWNEIALVWHEGQPQDELGRRRLSARLRKRFERLTERLRKLATEEGWVPVSEGEDHFTS